MSVQGGRTHSAVLIPLFCDPDRRLHAVFTKRREDLSRHPGEISFPGGRRDDGESLKLTQELASFHCPQCRTNVCEVSVVPYRFRSALPNVAASYPLGV